MTHLDKVFHCPRCALRFAARTELEYHLREDHRSFRRGSYEVAAKPANEPARRN